MIGETQLVECWPAQHLIAHRPHNGDQILQRPVQVVLADLKLVIIHAAECGQLVRPYERWPRLRLSRMTARCSRASVGACCSGWLLTVRRWVLLSVGDGRLARD
jgi:hypothetical protein